MARMLLKLRWRLVRVVLIVVIVTVTIGSFCTCVQASLQNKNVEYYTSQHAIQQLALIEQEVADAVDNYISVLEKRLDIARRFKDDYDSSGIGFVSSSDNGLTGGEGDTEISSRLNNEMDSSNVALSVAAHPFRAFRLLRRFVKYLPLLEKELRNDQERKFFKLTEKLKSKVSFPTQADINGATEGILRVHDTYSINIHDFSSGNFFDLATNVSMNAADCFFMGLYALKSTILTRAIEWLEQAYRLVTMTNDNSVSSKEVLQKLEEAISEHNKALASRSKNPYLFTQPVELEDAVKGNFLNGLNKRRRLLDKETHVLHNRESSLMDLTNFAALCGGKELRNQRELKDLNCWYEDRQASNIISPLKVERLSFEPLVLQLHDLISDNLVMKIVKSATKTMSRSQVHVKSRANSKIVSSSRTSTSTWVQDDTLSTLKTINGVYRKIEAFTGLKFTGVNGAAEDLQVSCYGIAGHFNPHLDTIFNAVDKKNFDKEEIERGDRLATIMFYLSDVVRGGATVFPRIGVKVEPVKGSALFWYNMDDNNDNGNPDPLTLHGGCPILYGNKCVANKWIRYNLQSRQCRHRNRHRLKFHSSLR